MGGYREGGSSLTLTSMPDARWIIEHLQLSPHPEGGHYRETYRHQGGDGRRGCKTAIYFLLEEGQVSHWHRVDAAEMWHFYSGAPLLLRTAREVKGVDGGWETSERTLGSDLLQGQTPQLLVEADEWQSARSLGEWSLVGCTVSPAFDFAGFELAALDFEP